MAAPTNPREAVMRLLEGASPPDDPALSPPETAAGPRADVYRLGAWLYQLATGRPPFSDPNPERLLLRISTDDPVPPRRLKPEIEFDLETVIQHAMQKEPERRYATPDELKADLNRFLAGESIRAGRRLRVNAWAVAAFVALLAAFGAGYWGMFMPPDPTPVVTPPRRPPPDLSAADALFAERRWREADLAYAEFDAPEAVTQRFWIAVKQGDLSRAAEFIPRLSESDARLARAQLSAEVGVIEEARRMVEGVDHWAARAIRGERDPIPDLEFIPIDAGERLSRAVEAPPGDVPDLLFPVLAFGDDVAAQFTITRYFPTLHLAYDARERALVEANLTRPDLDFEAIEREAAGRFGALRARLEAADVKRWPRGESPLRGLLIDAFDPHPLIRTRAREELRRFHPAELQEVADDPLLPLEARAFVQRARFEFPLLERLGSVSWNDAPLLKAWADPARIEAIARDENAPLRLRLNAAALLGERVEPAGELVAAIRRGDPSALLSIDSVWFDIVPFPDRIERDAAVEDAIAERKDAKAALAYLDRVTPDLELFRRFAAFAPAAIDRIPLDANPLPDDRWLALVLELDAKHRLLETDMLPDRDLVRLIDHVRAAERLAKRNPADLHKAVARRLPSRNAALVLAVWAAEGRLDEGDLPRDLAIAEALRDIADGETVHGGFLRMDRTWTIPPAPRRALDLARNIAPLDEELPRHDASAIEAIARTPIDNRTREQWAVLAEAVGDPGLRAAAFDATRRVTTDVGDVYEPQPFAKLPSEFHAAYFDALGEADDAAAARLILTIPAGTGTEYRLRMLSRPGALGPIYDDLAQMLIEDHARMAPGDRRRLTSTAAQLAARAGGTRRRALLTLATLDAFVGERMARALVASLEAPPPAYVLDRLGEFDLPELRERAVDWLGDPGSAMAGLALLRWEATLPDRAWPALTKMATEGSMGAAAESLRTATIRTVRRAGGAGSPIVRDPLPPQAVDLIVAMVREGRIWDEVVDLIVDHRIEAAREPLLALYRDGDADARVQAARAAAAVGAVEVEPFLLDRAVAEGTADWEAERLIAAVASPSSVGTLRAVADDPMRSDRVRSAALGSIVRIDSAAAAEILRARLADDPKTVLLILLTHDVPALTPDVLDLLLASPSPTVYAVLLKRAGAADLTLLLQEARDTDNAWAVRLAVSLAISQGRLDELPRKADLSERAQAVMLEVLDESRPLVPLAELAAELAPTPEHRRRLAGAYHEAGRYADAVAILDAFDDLDARAWAAEATRLAGDADGADRRADAVLAADPNHAAAVLVKAMIRSEAGRHAEAEPYFTRIASDEAYGYEAVNRRGLGRMRRGDLDGARDDFNVAVTRDPFAAPGWSNLGLLRLESGDPQGAIDALTRAIELAPKAPAAWRHRGRANLKLRRDEDALSDLRRAVQLDAGYGDAYADLAELAVRIGKPGEAIDLLGHAEARNAAKWHYHAVMALASVASNRGEKAVEHLASALQEGHPRGPGLLEDPDWDAIRKLDSFAAIRLDR